MLNEFRHDPHKTFSGEVMLADNGIRTNNL